MTYFLGIIIYCPTILRDYYILLQKELLQSSAPESGPSSPPGPAAAPGTSRPPAPAPASGPPAGGGWRRFGWGSQS